MTPQEFRAARDKLGMTGMQLAQALGMGTYGFQTISKWENGSSDISGPYLVALDALLARQGRGE